MLNFGTRCQIDWFEKSQSFINVATAPTPIPIKVNLSVSDVDGDEEPLQYMDMLLARKNFRLLM